MTQQECACGCHFDERPKSKWIIYQQECIFCECEDHGM